MRQLSRIECTAVGCNNEAAVQINDDLLCSSCAKDDLPSTLCEGITTGCPNQADPINGKGLCRSCDKIDCDDGMAQAREMCENMHEFGTIDKPDANTEGWCNTHKMWEAEGGPCAECERLADEQVIKDAKRYINNIELGMGSPTPGEVRNPGQHLGHLVMSLAHYGVTHVAICELLHLKGITGVSSVAAKTVLEQYQ